MSQREHRLPRVPPGWADTVAGAAAGVSSSLVTNPLEVVKIRRQNTTGKAPGTLSALRQLVGTEGIRGCYRGFPQTLLGYLPTWAIYFTLYEKFKTGISAFSGRKRDSPGVHLISAALAGMINTTITNPLWVVRTRFIVQNSKGGNGTPFLYSSTLDAFRTIYSHEGLAAFYKGLGASLLGTMHVIVMFPLYEFLRSEFSHLSHSSETSAVLPASVIAKMVASGITYPHEVLRTRLHTHVAKPGIATVKFDTLAVYGIAPRYESSIGLPHSGPVSAPPVEKIGIPPDPLPPKPTVLPHPNRKLTIRGLCMEIWREEGWRGFYKGFATNLVKTVPATAATMVTYEIVKRGITG